MAGVKPQKGIEQNEATGSSNDIAVCLSRYCGKCVYRAIVRPCNHVAVRCVSCLDILRECSICEGNIDEVHVSFKEDGRSKGVLVGSTAITGYCLGTCSVCLSKRSDLFIRGCCNSYICGPCLYPEVLKVRNSTPNAVCGNCKQQYPGNSRLSRSLGAIRLCVQHTN